MTEISSLSLKFKFQLLVITLIASLNVNHYVISQGNQGNTSARYCIVLENSSEVVCGTSLFQENHENKQFESTYSSSSSSSSSSNINSVFTGQITLENISSTVQSKVEVGYQPIIIIKIIIIITIIIIIRKMNRYPQIFV
jgi:hypothetical protein